MKNGDLPAMPQHNSETLCQQTGTPNPMHSGFTKREELAARFMAAWIIHHGSSGDYGYNRKQAAQDAVLDAEALLEELEKSK